MKAVLGFDMETDVGSFTATYEGLQHGTPAVLDILARHDATATFFFTGESVREHPEVVHRVLHAGHEVGAHSLFHETVGEPLFEIAGMTPILPEEVEHRLQLCTEWVEAVAGVRPVSWRCPRLFGSTAVVVALDRLGYVADATYPLYFYRERLAPYHPNCTDWTQEGAMNIVELPNFADLSLDSQDEYGRDMDQWPLFRTESADALIVHIDGYIDYCRERDIEPFLCFYFHPWEFHPMPQGDIRFGEGIIRPDPFIVRNCGPYAVEQLDRLMGLLEDRGVTFHQAKQVAEEY